MNEDEYPNDHSLEEVLDAIVDEENDYPDTELESDMILERQEMEDFEQTDEYFGCFGDDCD
jgi:hypothetical protein